MLEDWAQNAVLLCISRMHKLKAACGPCAYEVLWSAALVHKFDQLLSRSDTAALSRDREIQRTILSKQLQCEDALMTMSACS